MTFDFTNVLAGLRERGPVSLPHNTGDADGDADDVEDVSGYSLDVDPDGYFTVWHWFGSPEGGTYHGEARIGPAGIEEDDLDIPLTGVGLAALEARLYYELSAWLERRSA